MYNRIMIKYYSVLHHLLHDKYVISSRKKQMIVNKLHFKISNVTIEVGMDSEFNNKDCFNSY